MNNIKIKPLLIIIIIHLLGLYFLFSSVNDNLNPQYCITHNEDSNINYFYNGSYHIISNDQAIKVDNSKPYIEETYLKEFFKKEKCSFEPKNLEFINSNSYSESLRIWRLNKDLNK